MATERFRLVAEVSTKNPIAVRSVLEALVEGTVAETADGFHIEGAMVGGDARDLNRQLLTALRHVERRTRLRSEWTARGNTQRFFDYVPKVTRPAADV
ncbi:MAG: hypothetical protein WCC30_01100 [Candidatus Dormiibacterota bacterium]|jgi:hypothetical protein